MGAGALIAGPVDAPLVVLIHGLGGSHHTWNRVLPLIEPHARVHALDPNGTGSIEQEAVLAAELIPRPAVLVGHSRGGLVATAIAQRHRRLARKLILLCTPWAPESRLVASRPVERVLAVSGIGEVIWTVTTGAQHRKAVRTAFTPDTPIADQFVPDLRATGRRNLVAASRAIDTYLAETPLADRLSASGVPAELIFGEHDARVARPPSNGLTHTLLAGIGHTPPWEAAGRIAEMIAASLNSNGGDPIEQDKRRPPHGVSTRRITHMKAAVIHENGDPGVPRYDDVPQPECPGRLRLGRCRGDQPRGR
jgi:pimeloyl-ACP methyl ester carboxylesterase